ncbi:MAG: AAA family ATPase [Chloroflexota bacterium]
MFKSVRIQNFRQFRDLKLDNLAQINLITGENNTGKTSLLEAVYLLDGPFDPSRTVTIAQFRGVGITAGNPELWEWLFHNRNTGSSIYLQGDDDDDRRTSIGIRLASSSLIATSSNGSSQIGQIQPSTEPLPALEYHAQVGEGSVQRVELTWTRDGLKLAPDLRERRAQGFFLPDFHRPGHSEAVRLSRLEAVGREAAVVEALQVIDPRLKQLKVLDFGEGARVYADIGQFPLVPLTAMGQGFGKLLTIVAAILLNECPVYLIDEIAEGFHYSTLPDVWRVIVNAAVEQSAQIFATTHSLEALNAAVEGSEGHDGSLAFYRLERRKDEIAVVYGEDWRLRTAVSVGTELR